MGSTILSTVEGDFNGKHRVAEVSPGGYKIYWAGTFIPFDGMKQDSMSPSGVESATPPVQGDETGNITAAAIDHGV